MSTEAIDQAETNREAALLATADAQQARRVVLLWQQPVIPDHHIPDAIGISFPQWKALKDEGDTPPLFAIGRSLFVRTADLRAWLDLKAKGGKPSPKKLRRDAPRMSGEQP